MHAHSSPHLTFVHTAMLTKNALEQDYASSPSTPIAILSCNHAFHHRCLEKWLSSSPNCGRGNTCPSCREYLFSPPASISSAESFYSSLLDLPENFEYFNGTTRVLVGLDLAAEKATVIRVAGMHWQCRLRAMERYREEWLEGLLGESNIFS